MMKSALHADGSFSRMLSVKWLDMAFLFKLNTNGVIFKISSKHWYRYWQYLRIPIANWASISILEVDGYRIKWGHSDRFLLRYRNNNYHCRDINIGVILLDIHVGVILLDSDIGVILLDIDIGVTYPVRYRCSSMCGSELFQQGVGSRILNSYRIIVVPSVSDPDLYSNRRLDPYPDPNSLYGSGSSKSNLAIKIH